MPLYRLGGQLVLFVHIPKTGGSSIESALRHQTPEALNDMQYLYNKKNFSRCSAQHFHADILDRIVPATFVDHSFAVVRNPFRRIVSEFKYRQTLKKKFPRRWGRWIASEPAEINAWIAYTFDRFDNDRFLYDNHIRPQSEFLREHDTVFRLEDGLGPVFDWLTNVAGHPVREPRKRALASSEQDPELTRESIRRVADAYSKDFETLGYPAEYA